MKLRLYVMFGILSLITFLNGCATNSEVKPYIINPMLSPRLEHGVVFSLPRTILEVKIIYSLYEKKTWAADAHGNPKKTDKDGKLLGPKSTARIVVVDKPIVVVTKNIPDQNMKFVFDTESLERYSKSTDLTIDLTSDGILKSTNFIVQDKTKEIISNATETVFNIAKIAAVAGEDAVELIPIKDVAALRIIDPASLTFTKNDGVFKGEYKDSDKAKGLFGNLTTPEVVISMTSSSNLSELSKFESSSLEENGKLSILRGIPYRVGGAIRVSVAVDDQEIYDNYHMFAQAGGVALIPINAKSFTDITQGLTFSEDGSALIKFVSKGTSRGEAISLMAKGTSESVLSGLQGIDQAKLDKLTKQKEILDAKEALKSKEDLAEIQAKIDLLKKEKELIDAELALEEAKKKQQESEVSE